MCVGPDKSSQSEPPWLGVCKPGTLPILYVLINVTQVVFEKPSEPHTTHNISQNSVCAFARVRKSLYMLINVTHWLCSQSPRKPHKCMFAHILNIHFYQCHTDRVWKALHTAQSESLVCVCLVNVGEDGDDAVSHRRMRRKGQGCYTYLFLR